MPCNKHGIRYVADETGGEIVAEFAEVMRQWGRLCAQHCAENADDCDGCLLGGTRADVCGSYAKDNA